jgi:hypothetical protein
MVNAFIDQISDGVAVGGQDILLESGKTGEKLWVLRTGEKVMRSLFTRATAWAEFEIGRGDFCLAVSTFAKRKIIMNEFKMLVPMTRGEAFKMRTKVVEVDQIPGGIIPFRLFLNVLSIMIPVDVKTDTCIKLAEDGSSIDIKRALLGVLVIHKSARSKASVGSVSGSQKVRINIQTRRQR